MTTRDPVFYGYTLRVPVEPFRIPEVAEHHREALLQMLHRKYPATEGREPVWSEHPFLMRKTGHTYTVEIEGTTEEIDEYEEMWVPFEQATHVSLRVEVRVP